MSYKTIILCVLVVVAAGASLWLIRETTRPQPHAKKNSQALQVCEGKCMQTAQCLKFYFPRDTIPRIIHFVENIEDMQIIDWSKFTGTQLYGSSAYRYQISQCVFDNLPERYRANSTIKGKAYPPQYRQNILQECRTKATVRTCANYLACIEKTYSFQGYFIIRLQPKDTLRRYCSYSPKR